MSCTCLSIIDVYFDTSVLCTLPVHIMIVIQTEDDYNLLLHCPVCSLDHVKDSLIFCYLIQSYISADVITFLTSGSPSSPPAVLHHHHPPPAAETVYKRKSSSSLGQTAPKSDSREAETSSSPASWAKLPGISSGRV